MELGLSLGSNVGDRIGYLNKARAEILSAGSVQLLAASALYETEPVDVNVEYQHMKFINAVLIIETEKDPEKWLVFLKELEKRLGRVHSEDQNAPRTIDVDILYAGNQTVESGNLMVPHTQCTKRKFVLMPLCEVRPHLRLPDKKQTVSEILTSLKSTEKVRRLNIEPANHLCVPWPAPN